jgi:hypothetical protein
MYELKTNEWCKNYILSQLSELDYKGIVKWIDHLGEKLYKYACHLDTDELKSILMKYISFDTITILYNDDMHMVTLDIMHIYIKGENNEN